MKIRPLKKITTLLNVTFVPHSLFTDIVLFDLYLNRVKRCSHPSFTLTMLRLNLSPPSGPTVNKGRGRVCAPVAGLGRSSYLCSVRLVVNSLFLRGRLHFQHGHNSFDSRPVTQSLHHSLCLTGRDSGCRESVRCELKVQCLCSSYESATLGS